MYTLDILAKAAYLKAVQWLSWIYNTSVTGLKSLVVSASISAQTRKKEKGSAIIWTKWLFSTKPQSILCQYMVDMVKVEMDSKTLNVHQAFPEIWIFWLTRAQSIPSPGMYNDGEEPDPGWRSHHRPSEAAGSKFFYHVPLPVGNTWAHMLIYYS